MVTLADALGVLVPSAEPLRDYLVYDDGTGQRLAEWHLPDPPPTAAQLAAVTDADVTAARLARQRQAALAAAVSDGSGVGVGNRAAESVGATRDNDLAETLAAVCDLLGVTAEQLAARIAARRLTTPPPAGAPAPPDVVGSATTRLGPAEVFDTMQTFILGGAGDPLV